MERVCQFLKEAQVYFLATEEGDQPRVRPFATANIFEGKLYIQTSREKNVSRQLSQNGKAEICAMKGSEWIRIAGTLAEDDRIEAKRSMLKAYPELHFSVEDESLQELYFKDAVATIYSFGKEPEEIRF